MGNTPQSDDTIHSLPNPMTPPHEPTEAEQLAVADGVLDPKQLLTLDDVKKTLKGKTKAALPPKFDALQWLAQNAPDEAAEEGAKRVNSYWRSLQSNPDEKPSDSE